MAGEEMDPAELARDVALGIAPFGTVVGVGLAAAEQFGMHGVVGGPLGSPDAPDISSRGVREALARDEYGSVIDAVAATEGDRSASMSGSEQAQRDAGEHGAPGGGGTGSGSGSGSGTGAGGGTGGPGAAGDGSQGGDRHKGGPIVGKDPRNPNEELRFTLLEGEHVMTQEASKKFGHDVLDEMNKAAKGNLSESKKRDLLAKIKRKLGMSEN